MLVSVGVQSPTEIKRSARMRRNSDRKMSAKADPNLRSTSVVAYEGPLDLRDRAKSRELDLNFAIWYSHWG